MLRVKINFFVELPRTLLCVEPHDNNWPDLGLIRRTWKTPAAIRFFLALILTIGLSWTSDEGCIIFSILGLILTRFGSQLSKDAFLL